MKEKIILIICIAFMLVFPIVFANPLDIDEFSPENETWVKNDPQEVNITTDEQECRYSQQAGVEWNDKENMTEINEGFTTQITLGEGTNEIYFQCNDTNKELTDDALYELNLDTQAPDAESISVNEGEKYTSLDSVNVTWEGFSDDYSGIKYYYYNYTGGPEEERVDNSTNQVEIDGLQEGNITFSVWAKDRAGNTGELVSSRVIIDQTEPEFEDEQWKYSPEELRYDLDDSFEISFVVLEENLNFPPQCRYKAGDNEYSQWLDTNHIQGDEFVFEINENWENYEGETLTYQCNASDKAGHWTATDERTKEIIENKPPEFIELSENLETRQHRNLTFTIEAYDPDGDELEFSTDLDEIEIEHTNETTAKARWEPTSKDAGEYEVEVTVTDGIHEITKNIEIFVNWVNDPPKIEKIPDIDAYLHKPFTLNLTAFDPDNEIPEITPGENYPGSNKTYPQEGLFSADLNWIDREIVYSGVDLERNESKGFLNVTPLESHKGIHNVTFTVSDGQKTDSQSAILRVGYCGDEICNDEYEDCETCPEDCGECNDETHEDEMAIMTPSRNCLYTNVTATIYELYERATCDDSGEVINGKEVCEPIEGATLTLYRLEDDKWEEVEEYMTGKEGKVSFIPEKKGQYRLSGSFDGFKDDTTPLQVRECIDEPIELEEEEDKEKDEDEEKDEDDDKDEDKDEDDDKESGPEEDTPGEVENGENGKSDKVEEAPLVFIIIYYIIIPVCFGALIIAVFIYYEKEKNRKPWLLKLRIWKIKKEKQIKHYINRLLSRA
ncbi:MAG: hypothetical protein ACOCZ6_03965 [Nanoarchaeota archaeon]